MFGTKFVLCIVTCLICCHYCGGSSKSIEFAPVDLSLQIFPMLGRASSTGRKSSKGICDNKRHLLYCNWCNYVVYACVFNKLLFVNCKFVYLFLLLVCGGSLSSVIISTVLSTRRIHTNYNCPWLKQQ